MGCSRALLVLPLLLVLLLMRGAAAAVQQTPDVLQDANPAHAEELKGKTPALKVRLGGRGRGRRRLGAAAARRAHARSRVVTPRKPPAGTVKAPTPIQKICTDRAARGAADRRGHRRGDARRRPGGRGARPRGARVSGGAGRGRWGGGIACLFSPASSVRRAAGRSVVGAKARCLLAHPPLPPCNPPEN